MFPPRMVLDHPTILWTVYCPKAYSFQNFTKTHP